MSYVRCSILGSTVGNEVWSVNPVFDPNGEFGTTVNQANLDAAANAIAALNPGSYLLGGLSTAMSLTGCRLEVRDDNTDALMAISVAARGTPLVGASPPGMSSSSSIVFSLRTDSPGPRGRGRIYWPGLAIPIGTDLRIPPVTVTNLLTEFRTYMNAIRGAMATAFPLIGFDLAVRSKTAGATPHVVRIQLGNVFDTQRRRRDTLREAYTTVNNPS